MVYISDPGSNTNDLYNNTYHSKTLESWKQIRCLKHGGNWRNRVMQNHAITKKWDPWRMESPPRGKMCMMIRMQQRSRCILLWPQADTIISCRWQEERKTNILCMRALRQCNFVSHSNVPFIVFKTVFILNYIYMYTYKMCVCARVHVWHAVSEENLWESVLTSESVDSGVNSGH